MESIKEALRAAIKLYLKQGDLVPEPIDKKKFKGNISYRTSAERHYLLSKTFLKGMGLSAYIIKCIENANLRGKEMNGESCLEDEAVKEVEELIKVKSERKDYSIF